MKHISRRDFLKFSALSACSIAISTGLSGCHNDDDDTNDNDATNVNTVNVSFLHGVASGDPLADKVIIWTRVTTDASTVAVDYEVATDDAFADIIHNGTLETDATSDFTVKVDIQNLDAGSVYYYRFNSNDKTSPVGMMKTLPIGSVDQVKMAVFSCANYPNGHFNVYDMASKLNDLDVTLHLGDYIYEYGMFEADGTTPAYATENAAALGRVLPGDNNTECLTVDDYRKRYALYRTDGGLQAVHAAAPMIVVWDDHEVANDSYQEGAENHNDGEGEYADRVTAALQAYFEWLPIRPVEPTKAIFRSFEFGNLVSLNMLETRVFGRDKQLSYGDYFTATGDFLADDFTAAVAAQDRTMLGQSQLQWLQDEFTGSFATWQVLGQQVLMGRMNLPAEILTSISMLENPAAFGTTEEAVNAQIQALLAEYATLKATQLQGGTLSVEDQTRLATVLPYNLDGWDGYFVERETILGTAKALQKNLVVLAGDTHNAWGNELKDINGEAVGIELATASVSSPGLEDYLGLETLEQAVQLEGALGLLIDDLKYTNLNDRGFMEVIFTPEKVVSNWHYVSSTDSTDYAANSGRTKSLQSLAASHTFTELS